VYVYNTACANVKCHVANVDRRILENVVLVLGGEQHPHFTSLHCISMANIGP
jgi:hypothetical protein